MSIYVKEGKSKNTLHWFNSKLHLNYQPQTLATKLFLRFLFVIDENDKYQHPHPQDANDDGGLTFPGICFHDVGDKDIVGWGSIALGGMGRRARHDTHQSSHRSLCRVSQKIAGSSGPKCYTQKQHFKFGFCPRQAQHVIHQSSHRYICWVPQKIYSMLLGSNCASHIWTVMSRKIVPKGRMYNTTQGWIVRNYVYGGETYIFLDDAYTNRRQNKWINQFFVL